MQKSSLQKGYPEVPPLWEYQLQSRRPEIVEFGYYDLKQPLLLKEHMHPNAFEFVWLEKGQVSWRISDNRYKTSPGEVFITRPGELHAGTYDVIEPSRYWWLVLSIPVNTGNWLGLSAAEAQSIIDGLFQLPSVLSQQWPVFPELQRLKQFLEDDSLSGKIGSGVTMLHILLLMLCPTVTTSEVTNEETEQIGLVLNNINEKLQLVTDWRPKVDELARMAGLSVSHFHRIFREQTGMSPSLYLERRRMEQAIDHLRLTQSTVTEIALKMGYHSSQQFATAFRRIFGMSPTVWRRMFSESVT